MKQSVFNKLRLVCLDKVLGCLLLFFQGIRFYKTVVVLGTREGNYSMLSYQEVDSAHMVKADLGDKVGALTDEINFLRFIYEEV